MEILYYRWAREFLEVGKCWPSENVERQAALLEVIELCSEALALK